MVCYGISGVVNSQTLYTEGLGTLSATLQATLRTIRVSAGSCSLGVS